MRTAKARPFSVETVLVALGSNLGNSRSIIRAAIKRLRELSAGNFRASSLIETAPVDCPPGSPPFLNAAVAFIALPGETPHSLLRKLRALERHFGRPHKKKILNEPRLLDLDLIAFGSRKLTSRRLVLPHPRAHLREFVLKPLSQIVPDFKLPGRRKSVKQTLNALTER